MGLTRELGAFASRLEYGRLPAAAVRVATLGFIDCVAVMLAGGTEPVTEIVAATVLDGDGKPEASLLFSQRRAPAPVAAWINGCAAHALDYDDAGGHRSAILVPALLAEGEALGASGADMIAAYVAGFEVWSELALRERGHLHERGWHPTGLYGAVAAAVAVSRLRGLDAEQAARAMAVAASQASGIVANFGSMMKPFHAGNAARAGLLSARLAANGMTASATAFEHPRGFMNAVSQHGDYDAGTPAGTLGERWRIESEGVSIKKYPTCYCTHRAIDAMLELAQRHDIDPAQVEAVEVIIGKTQKAILHADRPSTGLEGKFSIQFAMACALLERRVTLAELVDPVVRRQDVQDIIPRVHVTLSTDYDALMPQYARHDQVKVRLKSGALLESEKVARARGHIERPLSREELYAKFRSCLDFAASPLDPEALFASLEALPRQPAGWLRVATQQGGRTPAAATPMEKA
ncbi:MmgE/PrpD family protein [Bordetella genomosp. 10]|uniref:MmgE/PrpD family protein n=1 Tax=Bordetella genomosp. 10 TaxID=1416804 RepID=UPI000B9E41E6|nr:MmgE/PrpD family protein [Bordetella genomosp. 10]